MCPRPALFLFARAWELLADVQPQLATIRRMSSIPVPEAAAPRAHATYMTSARRAALYVALLAAWVALCGSLYMSEVLEWIPCTWCWYQRILMYPIGPILALGLIKRERNLPYYALLLAIPGALASIYHILLQKVPYFTLRETCTSSVPCSGDYLIRLGIPFVTIPMLALTAFIIIIVCAIIALPPKEMEAEGVVVADADAFVPRPLLSPAAIVALIVIPVVALFVISGAITNSRKTGPSIVDVGTSSPSGTVGDTGTSGNRAATLYAEVCSSCHGPNAQLMRTEFLQRSDLELLAFVRKGRTALESEEGSGQAMPASGGRPDLSDTELLTIIRYAKTLK